MAERRALERLLARDLSGKEIARLTLLAYTEELAGTEPTFSEAELERAKATLRGRPHDIAVYNAWIEASRIVDFVSLEAMANAADAEMRLSIAIGWDRSAPSSRHDQGRQGDGDEGADARRVGALPGRAGEGTAGTDGGAAGVAGCRHPLPDLAARLGRSQGQGEGAA